MSYTRDELLRYFENITVNTPTEECAEKILKHVTDSCPDSFKEDLDTYICGKLLGIIESLISGLKCVVEYREILPPAILACYSYLGTHIADPKDDKLKEWEDNYARERETRC